MRFGSVELQVKLSKEIASRFNNYIYKAKDIMKRVSLDNTKVSISYFFEGSGGTGICSSTNTSSTIV